MQLVVTTYFTHCCIILFLSAFCYLLETCNALSLDNVTVTIDALSTPLFLGSALSTDTSSRISGVTFFILKNYERGNDRLVPTADVSSFTTTWDEAKGVLTITGTTGIQTYNNIIRSVNLRVSGALYMSTLPREILWQYEVGHVFDPANTRAYYYVDKFPRNFAQAKSICVAATVFAEAGYLAAVTSERENTFLHTHVTRGKVGWLGGSDQSTPNQWRWVTGGEATGDGGKGLLFYDVATNKSNFFNGFEAGQPIAANDGLAIVESGRWQSRNVADVLAPVCEYNMEGQFVRRMAPVFGIATAVAGCNYVISEPKCLQRSECRWVRSVSRCTCRHSGGGCIPRTRSMTITPPPTRTRTVTSVSLTETYTMEATASVSLEDHLRGTTQTLVAFRGLVDVPQGAVVRALGGEGILRIAGDLFRKDADYLSVGRPPVSFISVGVAYRDQFSLNFEVSVEECNSFNTDITVPLAINFSHMQTQVQPRFSTGEELTIVVRSTWTTDQYRPAMLVTNVVSVCIIVLALALVLMNERAECVLTVQQLHVVIVTALSSCAEPRLKYVFQYVEILVLPFKVSYGGYSESASTCILYIAIVAVIFIAHGLLYYTRIFRYLFPALPLIVFWCTMLGTARAAVDDVVSAVCALVFYLGPSIAIAAILLRRSLGALTYHPPRHHGSTYATMCGGTWVGPTAQLCLVDNLCPVRHPIINLALTVYHLTVVYMTVGTSIKQCALLYYVLFAISLSILCFVGMTRPYRSRVILGLNLGTLAGFTIMFMLLALGMECPPIPSTTAATSWVLVMLAWQTLRLLVLFCINILQLRQRRHEERLAQKRHDVKKSPYYRPGREFRWSVRCADTDEGVVAMKPPPVKPPPKKKIVVKKVRRVKKVKRPKPDVPAVVDTDTLPTTTNAHALAPVGAAPSFEHAVVINRSPNYDEDFSSPAAGEDDDGGSTPPTPVTQWHGFDGLPPMYSYADNKAPMMVVHNSPVLPLKMWDDALEAELQHGGGEASNVRSHDTAKSAASLTRVFGGGRVSRSGALRSLKLCNPLSICADPTGRYVCVSEGDKIWAADLKQELVTKIACNDVVAIATHPSNPRWVIFVERANNSIYLAARHWEGSEPVELVDSVHLGSGCVGMAVTTQHVYMTDTAGSRVLQVHLDTGEVAVATTRLTQPTHVALDAVTGGLYVAQISGAVHRLDIHTHDVSYVGTFPGVGSMAHASGCLYMCDIIDGSVFYTETGRPGRGVSVVDCHQVTTMEFPVGVGASAEHLYYLDCIAGRAGTTAATDQWVVLRMAHGDACMCVAECEECGGFI
eukprot:PhM_4_TR2436/c1_g2_i1/m.78641